MTIRRPVLLRTVGFLGLAGLLVVNGWLLVLNLAKGDRLPAGFERVPGVAAAVESGDTGRAGANGERAAADGDGDRDGNGDADGGAGASAGQDDDHDDQESDGGEAEGGEPAAFAGEGETLAGPGSGPSVESVPWPGGTGPVPEGEPQRRQVRLGSDGEVVVVGSAPDWAVVLALVEQLAARLDVDRSAIETDIGWHPDASPNVGDVDVTIDGQLIYDSGEIDLPSGTEVALAPAVELMVANVDLYVVVVGLVDDDGGDEVAAVALARSTVVAEEVFAAAGIDAGRVVTSVAPASQGSGGSGDQVVVRIENLLVVGPGG